MKQIIYYASTKRDIGSFPSKAKQRIARLLDMVAANLELQPNDFKYMPAVGMGTYELRIKTNSHYRVFYVTKFEEAIYVLHAFVKKTQETPLKDIEKGKERYKALLRYRRGENYE